jgi:hypothetical protein
MSIYVYIAYGKYILSTSLPCREQMEGQLQSDVRPPITANDIHRRVLLVVCSFSKKYVSAQWDLASAYLCLTLRLLVLTPDSGSRGLPPLDFVLSIANSYYPHPEEEQELGWSCTSFLCCGCPVLCHWACDFCGQLPATPTWILQHSLHALTRSLPQSHQNHYYERSQDIANASGSGNCYSLCHTSASHMCILAGRIGEFACHSRAIALSFWLPLACC